LLENHFLLYFYFQIPDENLLKSLSGLLRSHSCSNGSTPGLFGKVSKVFVWITLYFRQECNRSFRTRLLRCSFERAIRPLSLSVSIIYTLVQTWYEWVNIYGPKIPPTSLSRQKIWAIYLPFVISKC
jgi:hypothetical protein